MTLFGYEYNIGRVSMILEVVREIDQYICEIENKIDDLNK